MKGVSISLLFAGLAAAHSAVWEVQIDGNDYPARDARFDEELGAKRIEWSFKNNGAPWVSINDVLDPAITCGIDPKPPALKAVARAGAKVTVQWSGIIQMHLGPVMSYLGAVPSPNTKPQDVQFFKIKEAGFDKARHLWANEDLINQKTADTMQIPSDIKPGLYILRTELLALHGNGFSPNPVGGAGPQFYTHCFNIQITGNGTATPKGVTFPGGYKREDPGVAFNLYTSEDAWDNYIIPGPPLYKGEYKAPTGLKPVVAPKDTGAFPEAFQAKYEAYKAKQDAHALASANIQNEVDPQGPVNGTSVDPGRIGKLLEFYIGHAADAAVLNEELQTLKAEAVALGIATPA